MRPRRKECNVKSLLIVGIPKQFCDKSIDDFNTYNDSNLEEVKEYVSTYIEHLPTKVHNNEGILFFGSNGVGKSMLASLILKEAYMCRYTCSRVTFSKYIAEYTSSWGKTDKDTLEQEVYEKYKGAEVLVLEEIGKEIDSKIAKPILEDLLRYREEHGLVTIMCCNLDPKTIREDYGASIISIMTGCMTPIKLVGKDRRPETFRKEVKN